MRLEELVEIDRRRVIDIGGSLYLLVPQVLRRSILKKGTEVMFLQSPEGPEIILRVVEGKEE